MIKYLITTFVFWFVFTLYCNGQNITSLEKIEPNTVYENVHVKPIASNEQVTSFIIWVKTSVRKHKHIHHTESVYILDGKAEMLLGEQTLNIQKGDYIFIPKGTPHAVIKVMGNKPLKVLSVQSPKFTGEDRIFIE
ncbi:cupin domain-containing protein [Limibacter armeniacum]|uniref:cupin domain-containing protein n=1 Tax=Limibacter armeniacum TaxID=466084 RepID=UPI002FE53DDE